MAKFQVAPEILAFILDLPEGTEVGRIDRVPIGDGQSVFQIEVTGGGFPDDGLISLEYEQDASTGSIRLLGFAECEPKG